MSDKNTQGLQGLQGTQGLQGVQGVQGCMGLQGKQGYRGLQGVQGKAGLPGYKGLQGVRGCQGLPGNDGITGIQGIQGGGGIQGIRGCQGVNGLRGIQGVQGIQGKKGYRGTRGYMGYCGDEGEIGIQGLQGEGGAAVWFSGIRLNGYNTNMFVYDTIANKFVSINRSYPDLLSIRNGAVIKVLLDSAGYNSVVTTNKIKVDNIIGSESVVSEYTAYYRDKQLISELLTSTPSMNCIVEFTFRDGAWYYSGGIIGGEGGSGDALFTQSFNVTAMNLGQMTDGTPVLAGERIEDVVRKMLQKVIDIKPVYPTQTITSSITLPSYMEVGSSLSFQLSTTLNDGYFESADKTLYPNSKFNEVNAPDAHNGKLGAGCEALVKKYYMNGNETNSGNMNIASFSESTYTLGASINYSTSSVIGKKSDGELSDVKINASIIGPETKYTILGRYKAFIGTTERILGDEEYPYRNVFTTKASLSSLTSVWINKTGSTLMADRIVSTDAKPSIVLVIPNFMTIESLYNSLGAEIENPYDKLRFQNTISYTTGNVTTTYNVYIMHNIASIEYKNIKIKK